MQQGFISLHRKLMDNPVWCDPYYLKLWMYCLFSASHKEHEQLIGNQLIKLQRGQFVKGRFALAEEMNKGMKPKQKLNDKTWWRYLENLEKWQMLTIKPTNKFSLITIDKYDFYQSVFNKTVQQMSNSCPTVVQQMSTNNNVNNGNKVNKKDSRHKRVYDKDSIYYKFALLLHEEIKKNDPECNEPDFNSWADDFRKLVELDKKKPEHVELVIKWTQSNSFWWKNVLSASKFRKQYERLAAEVRAEKMKGEAKQPKKEPVIVGSNSISSEGLFDF